jgi:hypothetical protein
MASSVVSFGFYFTADMMSGSRYLNLALMGALKFTLGLLPFSLSFLVSFANLHIISLFRSQKSVLYWGQLVRDVLHAGFLPSHAHGLMRWKVF